MPKIRFYQVRTLLWTYLVWAVLNLWLAFPLCKAGRYRYPLTQIPHYWALLHIFLLWSLWKGSEIALLVLQWGSSDYFLLAPAS